MRYLTPVLFAAAAASVLSTAPAYADLGEQLAKLLADDGAQGDEFGISVAISGATAIVGAALDDDNGANSGSAYLFDSTTGVQITKLLADDGVGGDVFGVSVAISGDTAIVGARLDDDNGSASGSAYLFDVSDPAKPTQIAKLLPDDGAANDWFGFSVAISGATAIVGAYRDDDNGGQSGSAYLFDTNTGKQLFMLLPDDGATGDRFGFSVAISGDTAIIGSYLDDDNGASSGSAYLFDTTTGQQIAKILPDDGSGADWFGYSVALSGNTAIVGAWQDDDNGSASGSAYLFDTTTRQQIAKVLPSDGAAGDAFGWSVAIGDTTAIVGAVGDDDNRAGAGSAYLFDTTFGCQIAKLLADDGESFDEFGYSVTIGGNTAIVGAWLDDDNGSASGSAYLFDAAGISACPWDIDGAGNVGASDLLVLLASWGPCKGCCPADFDGTGNVGASDLLALLANWGPCP